MLRSWPVEKDGGDIDPQNRAASKRKPEWKGFAYQELHMFLSNYC